MKYEQLIQDILKNVGGKENIENAVHCATRLRLRLKDKSLVNQEGLDAIDGIIKVMVVGEQYQIVIGSHVNMVYKEFLQVTGMDSAVELKDAATMKAEMKEKRVKSSLIDMISGIFSPILGIMMATGVLKGLLTLGTTVGVLTAGTGTYEILYMVANSLFYFLPVYLGYTAMKYFGGTPLIGTTIGLVLLYPTIGTIMAGEALGSIFTGTAFEAQYFAKFLGIPVLLRDYSSTVFPVIVICFLAAKLEKKLQNVIPAVLSSFLVPMLTLVVSLVAGFLVVGPVISIVSDMLGGLISALYAFNSTICGMIYGALIQFCVIFGVHWGFIAIAINNFGTLGYDPVTIAGLSSAFAQIGVILVIMLKTKDQKLKNLCPPAIISGLFGITEPGIYGITLQNIKAFVLASIASGAGGAIIGFASVKQYTFGANGIFGWMQVINPAVGFDSTVLAAIIACIVSFVLGVILMATVGKNSIK